MSTSTASGLPDEGTGAQPALPAPAEAIPVPAPDGTTFVLRVLPAPDPSTPVVLVLPAMALKAKFYLPLATELHRCGLTAATTDLRGQGESRPRLTPASRFGYRELIELDLPAVIRALRMRFPTAPLYLFGHSLGGQLALLYTATAGEDVAGICLIGTGSVYWRVFGRRWFEVLWKIQVIGLWSRITGHWPGGMVIGGPMAGRVMTDWARHSLTGRYRPAGSTKDFDESLRALAHPILMMSLDADLLGPRRTIDYLCTRMPAAEITRWHIDAASGVRHLDHFRWVEDSPVIATATAAWIQESSTDPSLSRPDLHCDIAFPDRKADRDAPGGVTHASDLADPRPGPP